MPKLIGKSTRVVQTGEFAIDELAGNVASGEDTLSIARVVVSQPTSEPWLTLDYDEWICVLKGRMDLHYFSEDGKEEKILIVSEGETCFVEKGERFHPVFPQGGTEYIPVCIPAFKPERCKREEVGVSSVSKKLQELHSNGKNDGTSSIEGISSKSSITSSETLYHMCEKKLWEEAIVSNKTAYFPPTFAKDGYFTHATAVPKRLLETANHFYTSTEGEWVCVEMSHAALKNLGITVRFEEAKPVGETDVSSVWGEWACPHIFAGIPGHVKGVVTDVYKMTRDEETGLFLAIDGIPK